MNNYQIKIPAPCAMDWNGMVPKDDGKYCNSCDKIVVDFTKMNNGEVLTYFKTYSTQRICGHFKTSQVVKNQPDDKNYLSVLKLKFEKISFSPLRFASLLLLGFVMTLAGCATETTGQIEELTGDTVCIENTDLDSNTMINGTQETGLSGEAIFTDDEPLKK